ncbi:MAG TPA: sigma-70 family RNA polymerase sigma factor [Gemmataceae bacterium]|jgi:RNA polymerase sigma-70 factor (ECF subfamily)|nr:sigma-70 family RNA polymerase sigma factor [Gemmataceae bacterium]
MALAADPQAWPLENYHGYLLALARLRLGPRQVHYMGASDAVQEALLKAHQHRHQFRGQTEAAWRAWLRRILANTLADAFGFDKAERIQKSLDETSSRLQGWAAEQTSPSGKAQRNELMLLLAGAMTRLTEDERVALELRYLHEPRWSLAEIARHLHRRTEKAVAGLLARGLVKLRDQLRDSQ